MSLVGDRPHKTNTLFTKQRKVVVTEMTGFASGSRLRSRKTLNWDVYVGRTEFRLWILDVKKINSLSVRGSFRASVKVITGWSLQRDKGQWFSGGSQIILSARGSQSQPICTGNLLSGWPLSFLQEQTTDSVEKHPQTENHSSKKILAAPIILSSLSESELMEDEGDSRAVSKNSLSIPIKHFSPI